MHASVRSGTFSYDATGPHRISLILPAYNESESIRTAIIEADAALAGLVETYEIIVVDDGSRDDTAAETERLAQRYRSVRLLRHETNRGYGAALRTGFAAARYDRVVFTDADAQFDLGELDRFLLLSEQYPVVCGYRIDRQDAPLRCFYSRVYNTLVSGLIGTGVRDIDCAMKMFHREVIRDMPITTDGFLVNTELLGGARRRGIPVVEVGVTHRPREAGQSTVSPRHIPGVAASLLRYWWNDVQFFAAAGGEQSDVNSRAGLNSGAEPSSGAGRGRSVVPRWVPLALWLAAAVLLLTHLGYPLIDRDETRYAEIPREMLVSGNWIVPQLNFEPYFDKPPLFYWLCAASYSLSGISESAARLVPVLCSLGTLAATLLFAGRWFGRTTGLLAGAVLLLSVGFLAVSRFLLLDGLLTLLVTLSLASAYEAIRADQFQWRWWLVSTIACGLGVLTKGPVSLVLLIPPVFAFGWLTRTAVQPRIWHWGALVAGAAGIAAPWFVAVCQQQPSYGYEFFYRHHVARFAGAFHERPIWFFLPILLIACHPWSFLSIPLASFLARRGESARLRRPVVLGFLLLWGGWCVLFFSLSKCKLPTYILPALPPFAMCVAHYLDRSVLSAGVASPLAVPLRRAAGLATITTGAVGFGFGIYTLQSAGGVPAVAVTAVLFWTTVVAFAVLGAFRTRKVATGWGICGAFVLLLSVEVLHHDLPAYAHRQTVFGPTSPLPARLPELADAEIVTLAHEWSEVPFYLRRQDIRRETDLRAEDLGRLPERGERCLIVMPEQSNHPALEEMANRGATLRTIARRGPAKIVEAVWPEPPTTIAAGDWSSGRR